MKGMDNTFSGKNLSSYDAFKKKQDADRQNSDMLASYKRMYRQLKSDPSKLTGNNGKWYGGSNVKDFSTEFGGYYGKDNQYDKNHDYNKWTNYGTVGASGNVFGDDFKLYDSTAPSVQDEYNAAKKNNENEIEAYKKAYKDYKATMNAADGASQRAYINKMHSMRNAQTQSSALGRGGLGTTESYYRNLDNNYQNTKNQIAKQTNETADDIYNQYKAMAKRYKETGSLLENQAKTEYGDYLIDKYQNKYAIDAEDPNATITGAKLNQDGYKDANGNIWLDDKGNSRYNGKAYFTEEQEKSLIDEINAEREKNKYFLDTADHESILDGLISDIQSYGSKNEDYNTIKQQYKDWYHAIQAKKPENYEMRGAVANIGDNGISLFQEGVTYNPVTQQYTPNMKQGVKIGQANYRIEDNAFGGLIEYNNKLQKEAPEIINGKQNGDIVYVNEEKYLLRNGKWYRLIPRGM